jgi:hypothetical protein
MEQYQGGRSSVWYWRQTLVTIGRGTAEDIRTHKLLSSRALMIGWALTLFAKHYFRIWQWPGIFASFAINNWLLTSGHESLRWWWFQSHLVDLPRFG